MSQGLELGDRVLRRHPRETGERADPDSRFVGLGSPAHGVEDLRSIERRLRDGLEARRGRPFADGPNELRARSDGHVVVRVPVPQHGRSCLDGAGPVIRRDDDAQRARSTRVPDGGSRPGERDVLAQPVVTRSPEVAQDVGCVVAGQRGERRDGTHRLGPHQRIGIDAGGLRQRLEIVGIRRVAACPRRLTAHVRIGIAQRLEAGRMVLGPHEAARTDRTPAPVRIDRERARGVEVETAAVDASERRLGARFVVRLHALGEGVVELVRAGPCVMDALDGVGSRGRPELAIGDLLGERGGLGVRERRCLLLLLDGAFQGTPVAALGGAHCGRRSTRYGGQSPDHEKALHRQGRLMAQHRPGQVNVDVIVNRKARGLGERSRLRGVLVDAAARAGARVHETTTLVELDRAAQEIAGRGADAIVLAGGDGSHMGGLSALSRAWPGALPPVGLAPGGTVCTIARNLGMRGATEAWSERVLRAACEPGPRTKTHATLRVRDDAGGNRVGFIFGAGLVAHFFSEYYGGSDQGLIPAAGIAARVFVGSLVGSALARRVLAPVTCTIDIEGATHANRAWSLLLASVLRDVGLHVLATYRAGGAERFHVVASGLSPRALALEVPRVLSGRAIRGEPRVDALATSLKVAFDEPGAYVLDGDVMHARQVEVAPGPAIGFIVP